MKLASDADEDCNDDEVPRYVPVQDISAFPEETEYLFSGNQNKFKLIDIKDCKTNKWHKHEMAALGNFQDMLQNGNPKWTEKQISMIQEYVQLVIAEYVICSITSFRSTVTAVAITLCGLSSFDSVTWK